MSEVSVVGRHTKSTIVISQNTIRSGMSVYPIRNLAHFGKGEISKFFMSWSFLVTLGLAVSIATPLMLFFAAAATLASEGAGGFLILIAMSLPFGWIGALTWKLVDPKHQGLLLTLSSGDRKLFITTDYQGIGRAVESIFTILENPGNDNDNRYIINIDGSSVTGNIVVGSETSNVVSNASSYPSTPPPQPLNELGSTS